MMAQNKLDHLENEMYENFYRAQIVASFSLVPYTFACTYLLRMPSSLFMSGLFLLLLITTWNFERSRLVNYFTFIPVHIVLILLLYFKGIHVDWGGYRIRDPLYLYMYLAAVTLWGRNVAANIVWFHLDRAITFNSRRG